MRLKLLWKGEIYLANLKLIKKTSHEKNFLISIEEKTHLTFSQTAQRGSK